MEFLHCTMSAFAVLGKEDSTQNTNKDVYKRQELICDGYQSTCTAAVTTSSKTTRWPVDAPDEQVTPAVAEAVQQAAQTHQAEVERSREQAEKALFELRTVILNTQD